MITEKDLIFPIPSTNNPNFFTQVAKYRSDFLKVFRKETDPVSAAQDAYTALVKAKASKIKIEGLAQIIKGIEGIPPEKQKQNILAEPLYFNGQIVRLGHLSGCATTETLRGVAFYDGHSKLTIKDTKGPALKFIAVTVDGKELLVCNKNLLCNISWDQLNEQGLIFGKEVMIDGQKYLLRVLTGGENALAPSEWNTMMSIVGTDNNIWHWSESLSMCQETVRGDTCVYRGYSYPAYWDTEFKDIGSPYRAWRPVLEKI